MIINNIYKVSMLQSVYTLEELFPRSSCDFKIHYLSAVSLSLPHSPRKWTITIILNISLRFHLSKIHLYVTHCTCSEFSFTCKFHMPSFDIYFQRWYGYEFPQTTSSSSSCNVLLVWPGVMLFEGARTRSTPLLFRFAVLGLESAKLLITMDCLPPSRKLRTRSISSTHMHSFSEER